VEICPSGNGNHKVTACCAKLVPIWLTVCGYTVLIQNHQSPNSASYPAGWEMSSSQGAVAVLCSKESNRTSGFTLTMHYRICGISNCRLNGLKKGNEHSGYTPLRSMASFNFYLYCRTPSKYSERSEIQTL